MFLNQDKCQCESDESSLIRPVPPPTHLASAHWLWEPPSCPCPHWSSPVWWGLAGWRSWSWAPRWCSCRWRLWAGSHTRRGRPAPSGARSLPHQTCWSAQVWAQESTEIVNQLSVIIAYAYKIAHILAFLRSLYVYDFNRCIFNLNGVYCGM